MRRQLLWVVALALAGFTTAYAQETTSGSITGTVVDAQNAPIPGATITVTTTQGSKSFVTDSAGRFFAPYLTPGKVAIKVELAGFSPIEQKNLDVRLGQRLELSFTMKVGALEEVVEVVGAAPVIDTSSTTAGGVLDSDSLKRIPVGRNFTDTLYLLPGVSGSGVGAANPSVSGASGLENNYIVDGVNVTNAGYGAVGSYSIVFGSLGNGVTQEFIKETQVKTAGFEAEFGQSTGGVVNVVTQSGTNDFHGSVFGYFRPKGLEGDWKRLDTENGTANTASSESYDFGATLGGPLMKNKLFFFGAVNPQFTRRTLIVPTGFPLETADLGGPELGQALRKRRIISYAGKLTFQATSNHRFDITAFGDPSHGDNGPQRLSSLFRSNKTGFSELKKYGGHNQTLRYDGILSRSWLLEASVARAKNTIEEVPEIDEWNVTDRTVTPNIRSGGIGFYEKGNEGTNTQYQLKSTNIFEAGGNHQVRYGVAFEDIKYDQINSRTGPTFTLPDGTKTATGASVQILKAPEVPGGRIFRVVRANLNTARPTKQKYLNFFLQDTWAVNKNLTIRPGIRYEQQRLTGVPPGGVNPVLCHEDDTVPGRGDGTGAAIPCSFKWNNNWAPRIGAIYDPKGNGKAKIFASYGRFYAKIPNDLAARALSADAGVTRADYFDANLTQPVPAGTLAAGATTHFLLAGAGASQIAKSAKSTYQDEIMGGFEIEAAPRLNVGVRYIHRTLPRILEDYQPAPAVAFFLGCPGAESVEYLIDNISPALARFHCDGIDPDASFEDPKHKYDSVEVTANKAFSDNWSLTASYRWARLKGNFEGFFRNDNGQSDPAITSLFDFPTNDPSYTTIGVPEFGFSGDMRFLGCTLGCGTLPNDRTHQFKFSGSYSFSDLNLGIRFNASSGAPLTALAAHPVYENSGEIPETIRGGGIQTVTDGFRKRTPFETTLDLHADYTIKIADSRRMSLFADVFNVLNRREATDYDTATQTTFQAANPDFGQPAAGLPTFDAPRSIRLGARFEW